MSREQTTQIIILVVCVSVLLIVGLVLATIIYRSVESVTPVCRYFSTKEYSAMMGGSQQALPVSLTCSHAVGSASLFSAV